MKKPINLDKYKDFSDDHLIDSSQLAAIFQVERNSVTTLTRMGYLPEHKEKKMSVQISFNNQRRKLMKKFWSLGTIRSIGDNS